MVKKSKVGSTGRFGARYGRKAKRTVKDVEDKCTKNIFVLDVTDQV